MIVGAGPNGLAAAITLARAGRSVLVLEGKETIGGGTRSAELTLPGFVHDVCSAIHPLGVARRSFGACRWRSTAWSGSSRPPPSRIRSTTARAILVRALGGSDRRPAGRRRGCLPAADGAAGRRLAQRAAGDPRPAAFPAPPAQHGALRPAGAAARRDPGQAALSRRARARRLRGHGRPLHAAAGVAGDRRLRPDARHPGPRGRLADGARRLAAHRRRAGRAPPLARRRDRDRPSGRALDDLPPRPRHPVRRDAAPVGAASPATACRPATGASSRGYRYGPGVFKVDCALDGPIPWRAAECLQAGTVHLGGTLEEIAAVRARRLARRTSRAALRPPRAADPLRSRRARRRASTPPGPTAMCRTARPWT